MRVQPELRGLALLDAAIAHIEGGGTWNQHSWSRCLAGIICRIAGDQIEDSSFAVTAAGVRSTVPLRARDLLGGDIAYKDVSDPDTTGVALHKIPAHCALFFAGATRDQIKAVRAELGPPAVRRRWWRRRA